MITRLSPANKVLQTSMQLKQRMTTPPKSTMTLRPYQSNRHRHSSASL
ncbi:hypothetical protein DNTS_008590 [Danionella cerebrum]|uniref:Uncharacterized protein n=1 Tax=Danionella cerebrum TaxID=2873325 RepID=A0A553R932_9TELE|nr:hypothetical protein DNTS_008590 [Danionella translucida]